MQRRKFILWGGQTALFSVAGLSSMANLNRLHFSSFFDLTTEPLAKELEKLIPKLMQEAKIPGLSIALVRNGQLSWSKGFGVKDQLSQKPVNPNTIFEIASVSKTVFAYAVMKLCEKGIIDLDIPLVRYANIGFLDNDPRINLITARHVLSHRSGLQNWRSQDEPIEIHFDPGTDFLYSGEGYYYLQSIVTQLTGKVNPNECGSYEGDVKVCASDIGDYLEKNVLRPFGMNNSGYVWTEAIGTDQALPHDPNGQLTVKSHQTATDMARYAAAGGLLTSANDYARFIIGLFSPKDNDPFILNMKSMMEMVRPQIKLREEQKIDGASSWALGWAVQERPEGNVILHSGGQTGFRSLAVVSLEKKNGFVMLTNCDNGAYVLNNPQVEKVLNRLFV